MCQVRFSDSAPQKWVKTRKKSTQKQPWTRQEVKSFLRVLWFKSKGHWKRKEAIPNSLLKEEGEETRGRCSVHQDFLENVAFLLVLDVWVKCHYVDLDGEGYPGVLGPSEQKQGRGKQDLARSMWTEQEGSREHQQKTDEAGKMVGAGCPCGELWWARGFLPPKDMSPPT